MKKKIYKSPIIMSMEPGQSSVIGLGTGQGSIPSEMTYEEWYEEIAWGGTNPDADYNGDTVIDENDYKYYMENHLWEGDPSEEIEP